MLRNTVAGGHGFGLRVPHYGTFLDDGVVGADVVEVITENFLDRGGRPAAVLDRVRRDVPVALHGVSLSIGATAPLDRDYLRRLRALCDRIEPAIVSDHLCWGSFGGHHGHDLWPMPFCEEAVAHVVDRVNAAQEALGRQILLENVSSYVAYADSVLPEWEFLGEVARRADCGLLLDVNNVFVTARNHDLSAERYIDNVPADRVGQFHLAGHLDRGAFLLDNHGCAVAPPVWRLYERAVARFGNLPAIVEWDDNVPPLEELVGEVAQARTRAARVMATGVEPTRGAA